MRYRPTIQTSSHVWPPWRSAERSVPSTSNCSSSRVDSSPRNPYLPRTAKLPNDFRVAIIGAGIAGITAALACVDAGIEYQIIERNAEVGGTWYTTTYPGIGVDTPSAYYSLSRDINGDWSSYYPQGAEYQAYLVSVADKNDLRAHTRFGTEVRSVVVGRTSTAVADPLGRPGRQPRRQLRQRGHPSRRISQSAALAGSTGPRDVFGDFCSFRAVGSRAGSDGQARRDHRSWLYRSADRRRMRGQVAHLTVFQRQPHWVAPRRRAYRRCSRLPAVAGHPTAVLRELGSAEVVLGDADNNYPVILHDQEWAAEHLSISRANDALLQMCLTYISEVFGAGSELASKVTPDFAPYGKRIIRDPGGYYAALAREHVDVEASEPTRVSEAGIVTADGRQIDLDVIIYATGYYLDFLSTVDIRGRGGKKLTDEWGDIPRAYRGGMVPGFPNMFISSAPNYSPGHGAGPISVSR